MNKICTICNIEKDIESFYINRNENRYHSACKLCESIKLKKWKENNPDKYTNQKEKRDKKLKEKVDKLKNIIYEHKKKGCSYCGYTRFIQCLQFHHIDPSIKEMGVGDMLANNKSEQKILDEINKCIVLCANCHQAFHNGDIKL